MELSVIFMQDNISQLGRTSQQYPRLTILVVSKLQHELVKNFGVLRDSKAGLGGSL